MNQFVYGDGPIISRFTRTGDRARVPEARDALHVIVHIINAHTISASCIVAFFPAYLTLCARHIQLE